MAWTVRMDAAMGLIEGWWRAVMLGGSGDVWYSMKLDANGCAVSDPASTSPYLCVLVDDDWILHVRFGMSCAARRVSCIARILDLRQRDTSSTAKFYYSFRTVGWRQPTGRERVVCGKDVCVYLAAHRVRSSQ